MKNIFLRAVSVLLLALFLLASCNRDNRPGAYWKEKNGKLKVLTTVAMIHDLVQEIGGDYVDSMPLIHGGLDPHSYELVKGDDEKFAAADIIFYNGLGLEHGLSLRQNLEKNPKAVAIADVLIQEDASLVLVMGSQVDPHVWMDISLWTRTIEPILQTLSLKDPLHAKEYSERANVLRQKMHAADKKAYETLQAIPSERRYLVTSHDAFNYFAKRYLADPGEKEWQVRCQAPEGLAPEAQLSVTDILNIMNHIERYKIHVLFPESNVSKDSLNKILHAGKEKGIAIRLCQKTLYGDSMGESSSYLDMIAHNVGIIEQELRIP